MKENSLSTEKYLNKCVEVWGDSYDLSHVVYLGGKKPVEVICHKKDECGMEHGSFYPLAENFIRFLCTVERQHKFGFRKQKLHKKYGLPLNMTEAEMTNKLGYMRIYDCGLIKYVWRIEYATS